MTSKRKYSTLNEPAKCSFAGGGETAEERARKCADSGQISCVRLVRQRQQNRAELRRFLLHSPALQRKLIVSEPLLQLPEQTRETPVWDLDVVFCVRRGRAGTLLPAADLIGTVTPAIPTVRGVRGAAGTLG